jgi:hypothetical protein
MNITHHITPAVTPLMALWRWLMAKPGRTYHTHPVNEMLVPANSCIGTLHGPALSAQPCASSCAVTRRPVRVLQVMETGQSSAQVGRMRISGRMADVCAELDRLAAHEAGLLH